MENPARLCAAKCGYVRSNLLSFIGLRDNYVGIETKIIHNFDKVVIAVPKGTPKSIQGVPPRESEKQIAKQAATGRKSRANETKKEAVLAQGLARLSLA